MEIVRSSDGTVAEKAAQPGTVRTRQRRGIETERAIIDATVDLLSMRGIHATSLDAVSAAVGISKSSILWHFGSKEGLLLRVAEVVFERVAQERVTGILALPTLRERIDATWRLFSETVRERPQLRRLVLHLIFESAEGRPELRERLQRLYRSIRRLFETGLEGVLADASRRRRASVLAVATFDGVFLQWLLDPEAVDIEALHHDLSDMYQRAGLLALASDGGDHDER